MKKMYFIPTLLILVITISCSNIKEPEFKNINNFKVKSVSFTSGVVGFNVTYHNPNDFGLTVKETEADVYIDEVFMGKFQQDTLISVNSKSDFSIPVTGKIPVGVLLELNLQDLPNKEVLLKANGSTKVGKAGIYITKPVQYEGRHRLDEVKL